MRLFRSFENQKQRRSVGGSCFLEMQYCRLDAPVEVIVSVDAIKHWQDDSLYIHGDNADRFQSQYGDLFTEGIYSNSESGNVDIWGINYYSPVQVGQIISGIKRKKPSDWETVLRWLEGAGQYNGIYILGI